LSDIPALRLGRLFGIPIFVDATFLLAIVTIFFGVVHRQFPSLADYGVVVLLVTAGVFLSILTHELGHALVARRFGLYADEIRIGGFYGLAILAGAPARRIDSILTLLAGPLTNAINSILLLLALGMPTLTDSLYLGTPMFASPVTDVPVLRVSLQGSLTSTSAS
jgi:Zn-dependent protease